MRPKPLIATLTAIIILSSICPVVITSNAYDVNAASTLVNEIWGHRNQKPGSFSYDQQVVANEGVKFAPDKRLHFWCDTRA
jgi:hypothetical protein